MNTSASSRQNKAVLVLSALIISAVFLATSSTDLFTDSPVKENQQTTIENGDRIDFILDSNTTEVDSVHVETGYLSVDDMYNLSSPEISLESETCLRFYNYSGQVNLDTKALIGDAEGFDTCTLNASVDISINEQVPGMQKVSTRELGNVKEFNYMAQDLYINPLNTSQDLNFTNSKLQVSEFEGRMQIKPPEGIYLSGKGRVKVDGEEIES